MVKFLAPLLLLSGTFVTLQWAIPAGYAFMIGLVSCSQLLALTNRKVEIKKKYPWSEAETAIPSQNLHLVTAAIAFSAFIAFEYLSSIAGGLPARIGSFVQFAAGAALSISISLVIAFVRERQAVKRQYP